MRRLTATAVALGSFIGGVLLGFGGSREIYRGKLTAYEMANIDHMSMYVEVQRFEGTPQTYEAALRDFLLALDERERAGPGLFSTHTPPVDRALTYIRLSILASERNDLAAAAKYRSQAEAVCPLLGWRSCSAEEMTAVVRRLDEHSLWNPKSKSVPGHGS
jgi:hypothetical protein